ncbi:hypothetical protein [Fortiea contorta]|uniref:hypothetical protein n=1 Tax=Fortiea contorta TaxID=1892405 RepID=UPI00034A8882|nr:hypothetical protein [Fortiea contorta]
MNESLYQASLKALTEHGVPQELAEKASKVVAKDEPGIPHFGRSPEDQQVVNEAMKHYWQSQANE